MTHMLIGARQIVNVGFRYLAVNGSNAALTNQFRRVGMMFVQGRSEARLSLLLANFSPCWNEDLKKTCLVLMVAVLTSIGCSADSSTSPSTNDMNSATEAASVPKAFIDETQTIPAGAEWNREIVARRPGTVAIRITANAPKSIIVMTTQAFQAINAEPAGTIDKEKDILLVEDTVESTYEKDVDFPAGSFQIMMQNRSDQPQEFQLQCIAKANGG